MPLPAFCPRCGGRVQPSARSQGLCTGCGRQVYAHSRPAAGVLLLRAGQVLLVRRGAGPARGKWDIPGGFLEEGETPEEGARREIREELGLELEDLSLVLTSLNPWPGGAVLDVLFEARAPAREPRPGSDASAWAWFPVDDLPRDLAFDATRDALTRWRSARPGDDYQLRGGAVIDPGWSPGVVEVGAGYTPPCHEPGPRGWRVECGEWSSHGGLLCARVDGERPAALWYDRPLEGDHMIVFRAHAVPPQGGEIRCYWEGSGRIREPGGDDACVVAYVGGRNGGLSGIERHPAAGPRAAARLVRSEAGRPFEIAAGRRGATDFLFIDGRLALQVDDPTRQRRTRSRVALAARSGHVHFLQARVYRLEA